MWSYFSVDAHLFVSHTDGAVFRGSKTSCVQQNLVTQQSSLWAVALAVSAIDSDKIYKQS